MVCVFLLAFRPLHSISSVGQSESGIISLASTSITGLIGCYRKIYNVEKYANFKAVGASIDQYQLDFQLISSPKAFKAEQASWKAVIQLNVAHSIRIIIDAISTAQQATSSLISPSFPHSLDETPSVSLPAFDDLPTLTPEHLGLKMRLSPVLQVEESLGRKLQLEATSITRVPQRPWKSAFSRSLLSSRNSMDGEQRIDFDDPNDPGVILHNCAKDMIKLWNDPTIRALLKVLRLRLEDTPGL